MAGKVVRVMAKNIKPGDIFEGSLVEKVTLTENGNASIFLESGAWRRRPASERIPVERP